MLVRATALLLAAALPAGAADPAVIDRAIIDRVQVERGVQGPVLVVDQRLQFSRTMLRALTQGIPLRLDYQLSGCGGERRWQHRVGLELSFAAVRRVYELRGAGGEVRRFARRSALLAALDRVRLPVGDLPADCAGSASVALDIAALPAPLRLPAWLEPEEWRMQSDESAWQTTGR